MGSENQTEAACRSVSAKGLTIVREVKICRPFSGGELRITYRGSRSWRPSEARARAYNKHAMRSKVVEPGRRAANLSERRCGTRPYFSCPARFRTREKMRATPECFPRAARTEHRRRPDRRGAEWLPVVRRSAGADPERDRQELRHIPCRAAGCSGYDKSRAPEIRIKARDLTTRRSAPYPEFRHSPFPPPSIASNVFV